MLHVAHTHECAARTTAKLLRFNHRVSFKIEEKSAVKMMPVSSLIGRYRAPRHVSVTKCPHLISISLASH